MPNFAATFLYVLKVTFLRFIIEVHFRANHLLPCFKFEVLRLRAISGGLALDLVVRECCCIYYKAKL